MKTFLKTFKYLFYTGMFGLSAYCLYYVVIYSYSIYAIENHYKHINDDYISDYLRYMKSSYAERYTPPHDRAKNIPESAFWIPNDQDGGRFISVDIADNIKNTFNVKVYIEKGVVGNCMEYKDAHFIFKEGVKNIQLSQIITPDLPLDKISFQSTSDLSLPKEIKKRLPKRIGLRYLEYSHGYLVFKEFLASEISKC